VDTPHIVMKVEQLVTTIFRRLRVLIRNHNDGNLPGHIIPLSALFHASLIDEDVEFDGLFCNGARREVHWRG